MPDPSSRVPSAPLAGSTVIPRRRGNITVAVVMRPCLSQKPNTTRVLVGPAFTSRWIRLTSTMKWMRPTVWCAMRFTVRAAGRTWAMCLKMAQSRRGSDFASILYPSSWSQISTDHGVPGTGLQITGVQSHWFFVSGAIESRGRHVVFSGILSLDPGPRGPSPEWQHGFFIRF